jgi:hypothetical protein
VHVLLLLSAWDNEGRVTGAPDAALMRTLHAAAAPLLGLDAPDGTHIPSADPFSPHLLNECRRS